MRYILGYLILIIVCACSPSKESYIDSSDIPKFWNAYDEIVKVSDSTQQVQLLDSLYLQKGSEGLEAINKARNYTAAEYVEAINTFPKYWTSIRNNTFKTNNYVDEINSGIVKLAQPYPSLKPAKIYFTIGALRTPGTTLGNKVLIGAELALGDTTTVTSELQNKYPHLVNYFKNNNPKKSIVFNNVHEYVHTQQDTTIANSLLSRTLIEGVAEFIAEQALQMDSPNESLIFGKANDKKIKAAFVKEMFTTIEAFWFWGNRNNQFKVGDLGYYVGYSICKNYYNKAVNKEVAIREMISLDYLNEKEVFQFIDDSNYLDKTIAEYFKEFEENRPKVIGIKEFINKEKNIDPNIKTMSIEFSKKMDTGIRNFRLGPLGASHVLEITKIIGWFKEDTVLKVEVALKPKLQQQLLVTDVFRSKEGYWLQPYLIDITTK